MVPPHDRSLALDGIRGLAAVAVLLFHCGLHMDAPGFVGHGSLAVDVFFCMSGFVVERAYGARLRAGWSAASFIRARFERLYPLYAAGLALGIVMHLAVHVWQKTPLALDVLAVEIAFGAVLIPLLTGGPQQIFPLNGPSWSLFVEACTNVGFLAVPKRFGSRLIAAVVAVAGAVVVVAALARLPLISGGRSEVLWLDLARGSFGFGLGVLLSRLDRRQGLDALPRLPTPLVFASLAALLLIPRSPCDVWFDPVAVLLLCPALVTLAVSSRPSPRVGRWSARAGALSYPLYTLHAPLIDGAAKLMPEGSGAPVTRALALGSAAVVALALSAAVGRWTERGLARTSAHRAPAGSASMLTAARVRG